MVDRSHLCRVYAASIDPALHAATVIALGAAAGLDRAHNAIFYDFNPVVALGLIDNNGDPRPLYRAYEMMSKIIFSGAQYFTPVGLANGKLEEGMGAVRVSEDAGGTIFVLFVNRNASARIATVEVDGSSVVPSLLYVFDETDDPLDPLRTVVRADSNMEVPARSLVVAEF